MEISAHSPRRIEMQPHNTIPKMAGIAGHLSSTVALVKLHAMSMRDGKTRSLSWRMICGAMSRTFLIAHCLKTRDRLRKCAQVLVTPVRGCELWPRTGLVPKLFGTLFTCGEYIVVEQCSAVHVMDLVEMHYSDLRRLSVRVGLPVRRVARAAHALRLLNLARAPSSDLSAYSNSPISVVQPTMH